MIGPEEALERLREGNRRFVANVRSVDSILGRARGGDPTAPQTPFAVILGCSDSRVPAEIVFDQGVGDLFVIRVAGNIVAPSQVGSVEFAVEQFGTRLVVVLGHSHCGAIAATLDALKDPDAARSLNIRSIVSRVRPAVEGVLATSRGLDADAVSHAAVRANVRASAAHLRHGSELLEEKILNHGLVVVGAEYSLATGVVDFFDGV
jgi:carbonic anhydrase